MAMLTVNGAAVSAPSAMQVAVFDVASDPRRNAAGGAVLDRIAVKRRLEISWAQMDEHEFSALLQAVNGFFEAAYPDPESGQMRSISCYCSEKSAQILRMQDGRPLWTRIKMTWTER